MAQVVFPGAVWKNASPESQRVDPGQLKAAVEYLDRSLGEYGGAGTLFIVRHGYVIWASPDSDRQYQIYSATKSFTSTVLGLLIDDGMMQFGSVLTKAAGGPVDQLFKTRIADPIGMTQWQWTESDSAMGRVLCWTGGIHASSQELARFGHLFLNRGNWNGRQLVSASWIAQATAVQVPATIPNDDVPRSRGSGVYGYNWWVNGVKPDGKRLWPAAPPGTYFANGLHNNVCIVVPQWNMVIARTNGGRKDGGANTPANVDEIWSGFFSRLAVEQ